MHAMNGYRIRETAGFSLIELVICLAIISVAVAGTLEAINVANNVSIECKETTVAVQDARAVLDRVKITSLSSLPVSATANATAVWTDSATFVSNALKNETITVTGGAGASLRQITVTVQWRGPRNKLKTISFTTMKSSFNG